jgi:hypothetical protein
MIDSKEATEALSEINAIARRVRQSQIYNLSSLSLIMWGALVFAGHLAEHALPRSALLIWLAVAVVGIAGSFAITPATQFPSLLLISAARFLIAFLLYLGFGYLWTLGLAHFNARQMDTFWPLYFMLMYTIAGLWFGLAFVAIGLGVAALTLIGYFFIADGFHLWMAVVNGGGMMLGGLWMRRS